MNPTHLPSINIKKTKTPGVEYRLRAPVPNDADENSAVTTYFQVSAQLKTRQTEKGSCLMSRL